MPKKRRRRRYQLGRIRKTQKGAERVAKSYRSDGYSVKVVKKKKDFRVMVRK